MPAVKLPDETFEKNLGTRSERVQYTGIVLKREGHIWYEIKVVQSAHPSRLGDRMFTLRIPQRDFVLPDEVDESSVTIHT